MTLSNIKVDTRKGRKKRVTQEKENKVKIKSSEKEPQIIIIWLCMSIS
jgi:hypothetical protein